MTGELWHGTLGGYTQHRCRCTECRAVWAQYQRGYKARKVGRPPPNLPSIDLLGSLGLPYPELPQSHREQEAAP